MDLSLVTRHSSLPFSNRLFTQGLHNPISCALRVYGHHRHAVAGEHDEVLRLSPVDVGHFEFSCFEGRPQFPDPFHEIFPGIVFIDVFNSVSFAHFFLQKLLHPFHRADPPDLFPARRGWHLARSRPLAHALELILQAHRIEQNRLKITVDPPLSLRAGVLDAEAHIVPRKDLIRCSLSPEAVAPRVQQLPIQKEKNSLLARGFLN
jgi:hypothetical protein